MALSNYEKQKRWRKKNRALYNFQQRQRRKKGGDAVCEQKSTDTSSPMNAATSIAVPTVQPAGAATIDQLRGLIKVEHEKSCVDAPVPVMRVYRSETGMAISKEQWEKREEEKRKAKEKGFEFDGNG